MFNDNVMSFRSFLIVMLMLLQVLVGCNYFKKEKKPSDQVIARAFDKYLYSENLREIVPKGASYKDSITIIRNYINNWLKQQVVLKKAEDNLNQEQKDVSKQLEEYRNSLITYIYESELIRQKLDTSVADEDINNYYNDNQNNFTLKDNIVKASYLKVPYSAPKLDKVRVWYKSDAEKDSSLLAEYCHQFATDYYLSSNEWLLFDELLKRIPIKTYDKEEYLRNNRFIEVNDTSGIYFINIRGFKIKESVSPLNFERDNIRTLIINKRKLVLIEEMEKSSFENSLKENDIKIYDARK